MVEANRRRLLRLLAGVLVLLGPGDGVRRVLWRQVLARVLPMESALRRLIFIMARDLVATLRKTGAVPGGLEKRARGAGVPVFRLTDPPRIPDPKPRSVPRRKEPRIRSFDDWIPNPTPPEPCDDDLVETGALRRRMEAMRAALDDLPGQAKRLARWYARRDRTRAAGKFSRLYPIRSGRAPGHVARGKREVDEVLAQCHALALDCRAMVEAEKYRS